MEEYTYQLSYNGLSWQDLEDSVTSLVCRLTVIPPSTGEQSSMVTVQSVR